MAAKLNVITGATGLLGSHVAEQLRERGDRVRAVVRRGADTTFLRGIGAELYEADLADAGSLPGAVTGADTVYHCAAKVGEWGPWRLFQRGILDATRNVLAACQCARVGRVLHVSSITVYGHPRERRRVVHRGRAARPTALDVRRPLLPGQDRRRGDVPGVWRAAHYRPAELDVRAAHRTTVPRVIRALESGRVRVVGRGDNLLNLVYAGDAAHGAILAAESPAAVGRAYNLASQGEITQQDLLDQATNLLGLPPVRRRVPFGLMFRTGFALELLYRVLRRPHPPIFTRYVVSLIGRSTRFSTARAAPAGLAAGGRHPRGPAAHASLVLRLPGPRPAGARGGAGTMTTPTVEVILS